MSVESDLRAFLAGYQNNSGWRAAVCDWFADHPELVRTPVYLHHVPKGFNAWWHRSGNNRRLKDGGRMRHLSRYGRSSNSDIVMSFMNDSHCAIDWYDHGGFSTIAGIPVVVGEPYSYMEQLDDAAADLAELFRCPVSYCFGSDWGSRMGENSPNRIVVWYTFGKSSPEPAP